MVLEPTWIEGPPMDCNLADTQIVWITAVITALVILGCSLLWRLGIERIHKTMDRRQ